MHAATSKIFLLLKIFSFASTNSETSGHFPIYGHNNWTFVGGSTCAHACLHVAFDPPFENPHPFEIVHVQAGVGYRDRAPHRTVLSTWIRRANSRGFDACAAGVGGSCESLSLSVEWLAYVSSRNRSLLNDSSVVRDVVVHFLDFTTQKHCHRKILSDDVRATYLLATAVRSKPEVGADGAFLWMENATDSQLSLCYEEAQVFSGVHTGFQANVLVFDGSEELQGLVKGADAGLLFFYKKHLEFARNSGNSICKTVLLRRKYYKNTRPTVLVSPSVPLGTSSKHSAVVVWTESANEFSVNVCLKASQPADIIVTWAAIGTIDPCVGVACAFYGVCADTGPRAYECVAPLCDDRVDEPVCASNGVSYESECKYQRFVFETRRTDVVIHHRGRCHVFPFQRGRAQIMSSRVSTAYGCQTIHFNSNLFYPGQSIQGLATADFSTARDSTFVHDVPTIWIDDLTSDNMTVCVHTAGRGERHATDRVSFTWIVYQGAPDGAVGGVVDLDDTWLTGSTCKRVDLAIAFDSPPIVLATLRHSVPGVRRDAATLWAEDVGTISFSLCARELQNFDGAHKNVSITWLALPMEGPNVAQTVFSDLGLVTFAGADLAPSQENNYAFCKSVEFSRNYSQVPSILVTPRHREDKNALFVYDNIVAWVEEISLTESRICVKEVQVRKKGYDPVSVNYVVLPRVCDEGWLPRDGYCYEASTGCQSWTVANASCEQNNSSLASIHNELEAFFVGALSSGESWIGLYWSEDGFNWTDGSALDYVHWLKGQPEKYKDYKYRTMCVNELGLKDVFHWHGSACRHCHSYVCKKDIDECGTGANDCSKDAVCSNEDGSFSCKCEYGYFGDGRVCTPNECVLGKHNCDANALCQDTVDGFTCKCRPGFIGDGTLCVSCPSGYSDFKNWRCYKYFSTSVSWSKARQQCLTDGGDLVSIANHEEYTYVQNLYSSGTIWLGLNDIAREKNFVWSDGSPVTFTKWASTEPNNRNKNGEDCAHTWGSSSSSTWNDKSCTSSRQFVCKA